MMADDHKMPDRVWLEPRPNGAVGGCWYNAASDPKCHAVEVGYVREDTVLGDARVKALMAALEEQVFFHAMTLTLRRDYMEPDEIADIEFKRDRAKKALAVAKGIA